MKLFKNRHSMIKSILVTITMLGLSIVYVLPILHRGVIPNGDDIGFNINRIQELVLNLKHGNWYPYIYTYQFNHVPDPLGIFYPQLTTLPIALLCLIFKNEVVGICLGFAFYTFITMLGMYWVVRKLGRKRKTALVSAVVYAFSTYRAMTAVTRFDVGEFIAMSFVPITLYGLYAVMRKYSGSMALGLGLSMIMLSHVLSAFLCVLFLIVEFIWLAPTEKHWQRTLITLLKAIGLFVVSSAIWLVPFIEQTMFQKLSRPETFDLSKTVSTMSVTLMNSLNNGLIFNANRSTVGIVLLMTMVWGLIHYHSLDYVARGSLILGVATVALSTSLIPWGLFNNTPIDVVQFPFRLLLFSTVFLSLVSGDMFNQVLFEREDTFKHLAKMFSLVLVIIVLWFSGIRQYRDSMYSSSSLNMFLGRQYAFGDFSVDGTWHLTDYAPQGITVNDWKAIYSHTAVVDDKRFRIKKVVAIPDGLVYSDHRLKGSQVTLPVTMYKNVQLIQGSHQLKVNARGMVHLQNTSSLPIEYKYVPSVSDNASRIVSVITWCLAPIYGLVRLCKQQRIR